MMTRFNERGFVAPAPQAQALPKQTPKWLERTVNITLAVFCTAIFLVLMGAAARAVCGFFSAGWNWFGRLIGA